VGRHRQALPVGQHAVCQVAHQAARRTMGLASVAIRQDGRAQDGQFASLFVQPVLEVGDRDGARPEGKGQRSRERGHLRHPRGTGVVMTSCSPRRNGITGGS